MMTDEVFAQLKKSIQQDWPTIVFPDKEKWLDCLYYQDERGFYDRWITQNPSVLYLIQHSYLPNGFSMGARYGIEKPDYLSPYGNSEIIQPFFGGV